MEVMFPRREKKPSVLLDVMGPSRRRGAGSRVDFIVPRRATRISMLPWTAFLRGAAVFAASWMLLWGSVSAPTTPTFAADPTRDAERAELERQLQELEAQINEYQSQASVYQRQGKTLQGEIDRLNSEVAKLNLQVRAVTLTLSQLGVKIEDTEEHIGDLQLSIEENERALARLLRELHMSDEETIVEIFFKNPSLSDFFNDLNILSALQTDLRTTIGEIKEFRVNLELEREGLVLARADAESLRSIRESQRVQVASVREEKDELLAVTKGEEARYQALVEESKATAAEIRSRLFELLGGGELTFEEAYRFASLAGSSAGIRPALILAVLDRESALGKNVGRCSYKTAMHPTRDIPVFLAILQNLGINPDSIMVSCAITSDGAYGGAMGPAQFIPSTWAIYGGYKKDSNGNWRYDRSEDLIRKVKGSNEPSNPWTNADAFIATALYLRDSYNSSSCRNYGSENSHILPETFLRERCAAAQYYAGGRWYTYRFVYGDAVVERANRFEEDIRVISA